MAIKHKWIWLSGLGLLAAIGLGTCPSIVGRDVVERARLSHNIGAAGSLLLILKAYEADHGHLPMVDGPPGTAAFEALMEVLEREGYLDGPEAVHWQGARQADPQPWIFLPIDSLDGAWPRQPVFVSPRPGWRGRFIAAYADGDVVAERTGAENWRDFLEETGKFGAELPPDPVSSDP